MCPRCVGVAHVLGDLLADAHDRPEVARVGDALLGRLGHRRADVAPVVDDEAEAAQVRVQLRVADRRRAHVDAAPALAEVEPGADHRDGLAGRRLRLVCAHGAEDTSIRLADTLAALTRERGEVAQLVEHTAENRGVAGSSPALAIRHGRSRLAERLRPEIRSRAAPPAAHVRRDPGVVRASPTPVSAGAIRRPDAPGRRTRRRPDPRDRSRHGTGDAPAGRGRLRDRRRRADARARVIRAPEARRLRERDDCQRAVRVLGADGRALRRRRRLHGLPLARSRGSLQQAGGAAPAARLAGRRLDTARAARGWRPVLVGGAGGLRRRRPERRQHAAASARRRSRPEQRDRRERLLRRCRAAAIRVGRDLHRRRVRRVARHLLGSSTALTGATPRALQPDPAPDRGSSPLRRSRRRTSRS